MKFHNPFKQSERAIENFTQELKNESEQRGKLKRKLEYASDDLRNILKQYPDNKEAQELQEKIKELWEEEKNSLLEDNTETPIIPEIVNEITNAVENLKKELGIEDKDIDEILDDK